MLPQYTLYGLCAFPAIALGRVVLPRSAIPEAPRLSARQGFKGLGVAPDQYSILNSCPYPVHMIYTPAAACGGAEPETVLEPGATKTGGVPNCAGGNAVLKVYKDSTAAVPENQGNKPMQFEYGKQGDKIWYNLSFVDCVIDGNNIGSCPGAEGGAQIVSNDGCRPFQCSGPDCCEKGYCDPFGTIARAVDGNNEPNSGCGPDQGKNVAELGIGMELCAT